MIETGPVIAQYNDYMLECRRSNLNTPRFTFEPGSISYSAAWRLYLGKRESSSCFYVQNCATINKESGPFGPERCHVHGM